MHYHKREIKELPFNVIIAVLFNNNFALVFGLIWCLISTLVAISLISNRMVTPFPSKPLITQGKITWVKESNLSINDKTVYQYDYTYSVNDTSYKSYSFAYYGKAENQDSVTIEYAEGNPSISRVKGMSYLQGGLMSYFPTIFILIGLIFIYFGIKKGKKYLKVIANHFLVSARFILTEETNIEQNEKTVYKLIYHYTVNEKQYEAFIKTTHPENYKKHKTLAMYTPNKPEQSIIIDDLPTTAKYYLKQIHSNSIKAHLHTPNP